MTELGNLKLQVDELKQRLSDSDTQQRSGAGQLQEQLAAIKAKVQSKQDEIDSLQANSGHIQSELDRLQGEFSAKQGEIDRLAAENQQLRAMLEDVLSAVGSHSDNGADDALSAFSAEMAALVGPGIGEAPQDEAGQDVILVPASPQQFVETEPGEIEPAEIGPAEIEPAEFELTDEEAAAEPEGEPGERQDPDDEIEESPALRRILRRGRGIK